MDLHVEQRFYLKEIPCGWVSKRNHPWLTASKEMHDANNYMSLEEESELQRRMQFGGHFDFSLVKS